MNVKLLELPIEERIKLVEVLWDSIAVDRKALPITPEQQAELDGRLEAYETDEIAVELRPTFSSTCANGCERSSPP